MALAALSGEGIYHFGEVLATPILSHLTGTADEWLQHVVLAINSGDITQYQQAIQQYSSSYATISMFHDQIHQKALLLALITLIFERPSHDRIIRFEDIVIKCQIELPKVSYFYSLFLYFRRYIV
jgi:26S proteasome regulatory subunit N9